VTHSAGDKGDETKIHRFGEKSENCGSLSPSLLGAIATEMLTLGVNRSAQSANNVLDDATTRQLDGSIHVHITQEY
jgi:hypothetical protein